MLSRLASLCLSLRSKSLTGYLMHAAMSLSQPSFSVVGCFTTGHPLWSQAQRLGVVQSDSSGTDASESDSSDTDSSEVECRLGDHIFAGPTRMHHCVRETRDLQYWTVQTKFHRARSLSDSHGRFVARFHPLSVHQLRLSKEISRF